MTAFTTKDVLLVNTPQEFRGEPVRNVHIPMGPSFLSACLQQHGFSTYVLDLNVLRPGRNAVLHDMEACTNHLLERISVLRPKTIGLSCLFSLNLPVMTALAAACKKDFPHMVIITGGMHPTLFARELPKHYTALDAVVIGEGEGVLPVLARQYCRGEALPPDVDGVALCEGATLCKGKAMKTMRAAS